MFTCSFAGKLSQIYSLCLCLLWVNMFTWPPNLTSLQQWKHCCFTPSDSRVKPVALYTLPTSGQPHHPTVSAWVNGPWGRAECVCGGSLTVTLWLVSSVEITMDSNSEGSEGNLSPVKEDVYYGSVARRRIWRSMSSEDQYGMWCSFSPRWQFTLTRPEKAKNRSWTHAVISWWSVFCAGQLAALFSLA